MADNDKPDARRDALAQLNDSTLAWKNCAEVEKAGRLAAEARLAACERALRRLLAAQAGVTDAAYDFDSVPKTDEDRAKVQMELSNAMSMAHATLRRKGG